MSAVKAEAATIIISSSQQSQVPFVLPAAEQVDQIPQANPIICRYYLNGNCRFGSLCRFSHDLSSIKTSTTSTESNDNAAAAAIAIKPSTSGGSIIIKSNWANAPIFIPQRKFTTTCTSIINNNDHDDDANKNDDIDSSAGAVALYEKTWAEVVGNGSSNSVNGLADNIQYLNLGIAIGPAAHLVDTICPYQPCPYLENCAFGMHMELCEMCDQYCLHPKDAEQRRKHNQECLDQHEKDMELSFAIARSKDKQCGICFETIIEKSGREKRFGILPNCNHIFCLECIRKWRQAKNFEHKIIRSCPECRVSSDFVCPSAFWVDTKEDKDKLLTSYRSALGVKDCKYFKKGAGKCPFANKCFYKHALPNGENVDVGNPKRPRKARRSSNEIVDLLDIYLWEYVSQRGDFNFIDMLSNASDDTDESDYYDDLDYN